MKLFFVVLLGLPGVGFAQKAGPGFTIRGKIEGLENNSTVFVTDGSNPTDTVATGKVTGGEFVLTEQRPRMQSRPEVVPLRQGDAVAFAVHHRPVQGARGTYRVNLRHGVSRVRSGHRHTVGIIFHDAE